VFGSFTRQQIEQVIAVAGAAPSIHNSQPWRFRVVGDELIMAGVSDRSLWVADPAARALYISCGAALFNARIAIRALGCEPQVELLPHPEYPFDVLAVIRTAPGAAATTTERALAESIYQRHTNRGPFSDREIPASVRAELMESAAAERASLRLLDRSDAAQVLALAAEAGRELAASAEHDSELRRWVGVDRADGIPAAAVPPRPSHTPSPVRDTDFLAAMPGAQRAVADYERFPQLAVLTTSDDEPADWLLAGEALEHVLLTATGRGVSASFLYHLIERDDMSEDEHEASVWPWPENRQMILRLGYGAPAVPTPRRDIDAVM
jgi:nitroreductase